MKSVDNIIDTLVEARSLPPLYRDFMASSLVWWEGSSLFLSLSDGFDIEAFEDLNEALKELGYTEQAFGHEPDYAWGIGYGDDIPNAIKLLSKKIQNDPKVTELFYAWIGSNAYSEEDE